MVVLCCVILGSLLFVRLEKLGFCKVFWGQFGFREAFWGHFGFRDLKKVEKHWSTSKKNARLLWNRFQGESEFDNFLGDEPESNFKRRNSNSIRKEVREFSLDNLQVFDEKVSKEEKETENTDNQDIKSWMWNFAFDINVFFKGSINQKLYYIVNILK